jgi:type IV secretory pathway TrbL component
MPQQAMGVLQRILNDIAAAMNVGGALLYPVLQGYLALFGSLAIVWLCYTVMVSGHYFPHALGLVIRLALVMWMLNRWPWFLGGIRDLAIGLGLMATGNQLQLAQLLDPGALVKAGVDSGAVLWRSFQNNMGWTSMVTGFAFLVAYVVYVGAYVVMAYKFFWFQVELLLASLAGLCLLPTLCFRPIAFVATGVLSYAANMFARFLIGTILAGALWANLSTLTAITRPVPTFSMATLDFTIQEAFFAAGIAAVLAAAFLSVNRLAGMLTSGVPGMAGGQNFHSVVRMAVAGVTGVMTAGATAGAGAVGLVRLGTAGAQGALGAARTAYSLPSGTRLLSAAQQITAGAGAAMSGGAQAQVARLMGVSTRVAQWGGQVTVDQLMASRRYGGGDQMHQGVRR